MRRGRRSEVGSEAKNRGEEIQKAQGLDKERLSASTGSNQIPQATEGTQQGRRYAGSEGFLRRIRPEGNDPGTLTARQIEPLAVP